LDFLEVAIRRLNPGERKDLMYIGVGTVVFIVVVVLLVTALRRR
jgi:hypothetical protein